MSLNQNFVELILCCRLPRVTNLFSDFGRFVFINTTSRSAAERGSDVTSHDCPAAAPDQEMNRFILTQRSSRSLWAHDELLGHICQSEGSKGSSPSSPC